jgi:hypothetical protein
MKRLMRFLTGTILVAIAVPVIAYLVFNQPLPSGEKGQEADSLARKMVDAVGGSSLDSTLFLKWSFTENHHYIWDRKRNLVEVLWDDKRVMLNLDEWSRGIAYDGIKVASGDDLDKLRGKAWEYFCNDSFWLIAPTKIFEDGIERSIVTQEDGSKSLLVSYSTGGVTPGDSYLWHLDENGLPRSYQMWVSIIPIGGVEASWEQWETLKTGLKVPTLHEIGPLKIPITNVAGASTLEGIGRAEDPFEEIL